MGIDAEVTLGLDPGRDKVGFALVGEDGALLLSGILPSRERPAFWAALGEGDCSALAPWTRERPRPDVGRFELCRVVVGDGTFGEALLNEARERASYPVFRVDERGTTLEARELYWRLHRPSWRQRLLPRALRVPSRSLDDLAAWAIALRGFDV